MIAKNNNNTEKFRASGYRILFSLFLLFITSISSGQAQQSFTIINPYAEQKPYPYKASLHNHTQFHPEYFHAKQPPYQRLTDYRDHDTDPPYGIVSFTDHNRVTTPSNTVPHGNIPGNPYPWGVDDLLWIPGNEAGVGNHSLGNLGGHLVIVNASVEQLDQPRWKASIASGVTPDSVFISDESPASVEYAFKGTGIELISCTDPSGGIAKVLIDSVEMDEVNFFSKERKCDQILFQKKSLENKSHTLHMLYDRKGKSTNKYMGDLIMGAFVIHSANGESDTIHALHPDIELKPLKYEHAVLTRRPGITAHEIFKALNHAGCFLVLAHPNSRFETEGPNKGKQLWSSSGYVYDELDLIFGNNEKNIPPMEYLPHALEIGNRGYDFSERTGFRNAEEKWDYLLSQGISVWGTASDDSHGTTPREGWSVVYTNAATRSELELDDVMQSLFDGNFYASQGPNLTIELKDKKLTIGTEKPSLIEFISEKGVIKTEEDALQSTYQFTGDEVYVRARVTRTDPKWRKVDGGIGRKRSAWTNPFFVNKK